MGLYDSDGNRVGGCGIQIAGFITVVIAICLYNDFNIGIGWSILIACAIFIAIMEMYNYFEDK